MKKIMAIAWLLFAGLLVSGSIAAYAQEHNHELQSDQFETVATDEEEGHVF